MSWMNDLYQTYENNKNQIAKDLDSDFILLPIAHSTQNAQIEIIISEDGNFIKAYKVEKKDAITIIPVTEDSASRGNGNNPHPLADKLEYIAGDYYRFTRKENSDKYDKYVNNLTDWSESDFSCMQVRAVKEYIIKASMIEDLINAGILDSTNGLLNDTKIETIDQKEAFVRFSVDSIKFINQEPALHKNKDIFELYTKYYLNKKEEKELCYVTGKQIPYSDKHPSKIRYSGDKAKLISANDTSGFTYRGRFSESSQVATIGYEPSQKAHNALKWLIGKQGFQVGDMVVVAWETYGKKIIQPHEDTIDSFFEDDFETIEFTNEAYARKLRLASNGYYKNLNTESEIVVMGLEAATTGRLSISFYKKMEGSVYLNNIINWYGTCFWRHNYKKDQNQKYVWFVGTPSPKDIAITAFGKRNDKLIKSTIERLLPCIIDGKDLPYDIVKTAVSRASNPYTFENEYEHNKAITIACALVRKKRYDITKNNKIKEEWEMALDRTETNRSYLFGRLLGAARKLEEAALYYSDEKVRSTSAERFSHQFVKKPLKTWNIIEGNLNPYKLKLKAIGKTYYEKELQEIYDLFKEGDFDKEEPLTEIYLLGYNCQLNSYLKNNENN